MNKLQKYCMSATSTFKEGSVTGYPERMASFGASGEYPNNAERDLQRWTSQSTMIKPYYIRIPTKRKVRSISEEWP